MRQRLGAGDRILKRRLVERLSYWLPRWRVGAPLLAERLFLGGHPSATCPYSWCHDDPNYVDHVFTCTPAVSPEIWYPTVPVVHLRSDGARTVRNGAPGATLNPQRHEYQVTDVIVDPATGGCWTEHGWVLGESAWSGQAGSLSREVTHKWSQRPRQRIAEPCIVFPTDRNYFHWLVDFLPAFAMCASGRRLDDFRILGDDSAPDWAKRAAEDIGLNVEWSPASPVLCDNYFVMGRGRSAITLEEVTKVRDLIGFKEASGKRRILLSRRGQSRYTALTSGVEELLVEDGFEQMDPQTMSVKDQAAMLSSAREIVGWAGAGFANSMFLPPSASVVILSETRYSSGSWSHFARLAFAAGFSLQGIHVDSSVAPLRVLDEVKRAFTDDVPHLVL